MEEPLTLTTREIDRLRVIRNVFEHRLTWRQAAQQTGLCRRQIGYSVPASAPRATEGSSTAWRGRPANHRLASGLLDRALELVRRHYPDFGPTFANEKLRARQRVSLSTSVLRQGMIAIGLWRPRRQRILHRTWRPRRDCVGELVQLDGSEHAWFEARGLRRILLLYFDDATSRLLYAQFVPSEDTQHLFRCTQPYLERGMTGPSRYSSAGSCERVFRGSKESAVSLEEEMPAQMPLLELLINSTHSLTGSEGLSASIAAMACDTFKSDRYTCL